MLFAHIRSTFVDAFLPRLSEWFGAALLGVIGWRLTIDGGLMSPCGPGDFSLMLALLPRQDWPFALMAIALGRLAVLVVNGAWRRSPHWRAFAAFISCFPWTLFILAFQPVADLTFIFACGWLGMDLVNIARAMRDARTVDDHYGRGGNGYK